MRTRFTIQRLPFNGTGKDAFNNDVESWGDPVDARIYGSKFLTSDEPMRGAASEHNRLIVDRTLLVPPNFVANYRDRFTGFPDGPSRVYEVVGVPSTGDRNPFGWNPGGHVTVRYISG